MAPRRCFRGGPTAAILSLGLAAACNGILGIPEGRLEPQDGCVLNSDCPIEGNVCLFRVCSPPCKEDQDCAAGARCLKTDNGAACAQAAATSCDSEDDCEGATCAEGMCRAPCSDSQDCLTGQTCRQNLCFGTDPDHDSGAGGAGGGSGGNAGSGGSAPGMSGAPSEGGAGGMPEPVRQCETSATRCNDDGQRETCDADGMWGSAVDCPFVCVGNDCGGSCIPDNQDCLLGITPRVCSEQGQWEEMDDCPAVCVDGECEATCELGTRQCSGKDVMLCTDQGRFEKEKTCDFLCAAETQECVGECNPTTQQCEGVLLQSCDANAMWQTLATCPALCTPKAGMPGQFECSGDCSPTTKRCDDASTLQTCNSMGEYDDSDCAAQNKTCFVMSNVAGCYGSCAPGQEQCVSNKVQACSAMGSYVDSQTCTNQTCIESGTTASCTGSCAPSQQQCMSNRVQTCNASGDFADTSNCTTQSKTCIESGATAACTGNCAPGQTTCVSNNAHECKANGSFGLLDDCTPPDEICNAGACIPNSPYTIGNDSSATYSDFNPPDGKWYVVKVTAPNTANVIALRLIGRSATGLMRMAMWQDSGGEPGTFMAQTDNTSMASGVVSDAPVPLATKVTAGSSYWIGAKFSGSAQLYQKSQAGQVAYTYDQSFGSNPATTMAPFPIGAAAPLNNVLLNFYLLVQDESL